jgi:hypothetical protein
MKNRTGLLLVFLLVSNSMLYATPAQPTWTNTNNGTTFNTRPFLKFHAVAGSGVINDARIYIAPTGWDYYYNAYPNCFKGMNASTVDVTFRPDASLPFVPGTTYTITLYVYESTNELLANRTSPVSATLTLTCAAAPWTTDPGLTTGTQIKATHFNQLKTGIDLLRTFRGSGAYTYTGGLPVSAGASRVKKQDLNDLRKALGDANQNDTTSPFYLATGSNPTYTTDPSPVTSSTKIKYQHITELRANGLIP